MINKKSICEINKLKNRYEILYLTKGQTSVLGSLYIFKEDMKKFIKSFKKEWGEKKENLK